MIDGGLRSGEVRSEMNTDSSEKSVSTALFSGGSAGRESANRVGCGDTEIREPRAESREPRALVMSAGARHASAERIPVRLAA